MDAELNRKITDVFSDLAVDKREAMRAGLEAMPRFVTEFLLAKAKEKSLEAGKRPRIEQVRELITKLSVDADRKNEFISRLMREGTAKLMALLDVEPKPEQNTHVGYISQLDGYSLVVDEGLVSVWPELLYGGLWGSIALRYDPTSVPKPTIVVDQFEPHQLTSPDVDRFREARRQFTLDEWTQLLITSAGYRPAAFTTFRRRLLVLSRLIPLVQKNVYLVEMGPRGTGKSYLLRNLSSRVYLLAGAKATPAMLIYDLRRREVGIVGRKKVVVFDEIGATSFPDRSLVASLKDYMESGIVGRGGRSLVADCSFFLTGNLDLDPAGKGPDPSYPHYFYVFPPELCDTAIIDRIQGFIPGWELPKISDDVLADGVGLVTDYFGEVLGEMRNDLTFLDRLQSELSLSRDTKIRDKSSILRIASGLLKMLFPDGRYERDEMNVVVQVAVELRQRVYHQLAKMCPAEFPLKLIYFPGMPRHEAEDLDAEASVIGPHDDELNQNSVIGKITLLTVFPKTGGGDVAFVECGHVDGSGLSIIGLAGTVMQQSLKASYHCLLHLGASLGLPPDKLRAKKMSVQLVNIAEPKDGPSAGLAFTLAMLSAATHRPIRRQFAVTGEISLMGNVGRIGGLAEKLEAAKRHGRKVVIIPAENAPELRVLHHITDGSLEVIPVSTLAEAIKVAFEA